MQSTGIIGNRKGFTLIEIIAVLVLVGFLAGVLGLGLTTGVRGYLLASENAAVSQKAQMVMTRLSREILECFDCDANNTYPNPFTEFNYQNHLGTRTLELDGDELKLGSHVLTDRVSDFTLTHEIDGRITFELEISHQQGNTTRTFTTSILPRNL